jgi:hypothetical protein
MDTENSQHPRQPQSDNCIRRVVVAATFASATVLLLPAQVGARERTYDPREIALLPSYCKHTLAFRKVVPGGDNKAEINRWTTVMGSMFQHMHHYCWGLMETNKAMLSTVGRQERVHLLSRSITEFDYVIRHAPQDFVVLPEILTRKGENLIRMGRPQGIGELQRAIEIKPDYWPPYAHLSDHYKKTGDMAKAREWLEKGLSVVPDTNALKRRLAEVDALKGKRNTIPRSAREPETLEFPSERKLKIRDRDKSAADPRR